MDDTKATLKKVSGEMSQLQQQIAMNSMVEENIQNQNRDSVPSRKLSYTQLRHQLTLQQIVSVFRKRIFFYLDLRIGLQLKCKLYIMHGWHGRLNTIYTVIDNSTGISSSIFRNLCCLN